MTSIYLSHTINEQTPSYGGRDKFVMNKTSSIGCGDVANNTHISTTSHIGTHLDMPCHFFETGQSIADFEADFFEFRGVLLLEVEPNDFVICDELIQKLKQVKKKDSYDILLVKIVKNFQRNSLEYQTKNYGFSPKIASFLRNFFPLVRVFGFNSISVSSFTDRMQGRMSHKEFLNPKKPILLLEDMDLQNVSESAFIKHLILAPLRIEKCDGIPCTVIARMR